MRRLVVFKVIMITKCTATVHIEDTVGIRLNEITPTTRTTTNEQQQEEEKPRITTRKNDKK